MEPLPLLTIARLEESRLTQVMREVADETRPFLGGVMARSSPGTWANYAVGFGLGDDDPSTFEPALDALQSFYEEKGIEPRLETSPFIHKDLIPVLARRQFVVRTFEIVLYRDLRDAAPISPAFAPPSGLVIHEVNKADPVALRAYAIQAMTPFYPDRNGPSEEDLQLGIRAAASPRTTSFIATLDGVPVGAGGMETFNQVATLFGVSVNEAHRRKGIQQALIAHRLRRAREGGQTLATIGSLPGSPTERNVRRMGFHVAYVKPHLIRPGPGLKPINT
jgi:GNAT superfamily N-acetyltransferase